MKLLRIFVASPGDVSEERDLISEIVNDLRQIEIKSRDVDLMALRWETNAWPDVGGDVQDVINCQIGEYDIFVGLMWKRFGTPTKKYGSGTCEEFEKAYSYFKNFNKPKIMFYFKKEPFYPDIKDLPQFKQVLKFQKRLEELGVLFFNYDKTSSFQRMFIVHLQEQIISISAKPETRMMYVQESMSLMNQVNIAPWYSIYNIDIKYR